MSAEYLSDQTTAKDKWNGRKHLIVDLNAADGVVQREGSTGISLPLGIPLQGLRSAIFKPFEALHSREGLQEWYRQLLLKQAGCLSIRPSAQIRTELAQAPTDAFDFLTTENQRARQSRDFPDGNEMVDIDGWCFPANAVNGASTPLRNIAQVVYSVRRGDQLLRTVPYSVDGEGTLQYPPLPRRITCMQGLRNLLRGLDTGFELGNRS
ncbi:MAG: hypothetical protein PHZ00_01855 [Candidatus Peribacteraceae bacterium]|nr:hypothetical protein [Candidatus Peribacteraceae bacterium]